VEGDLKLAMIVGVPELPRLGFINREKDRRKQQKPSMRGRNTEGQSMMMTEEMPGIKQAGIAHAHLCAIRPGVGEGKGRTRGEMAGKPVVGGGKAPAGARPHSWWIGHCAAMRAARRPQGHEGGFHSPAFLTSVCLWPHPACPQAAIQAHHAEYAQARELHYVTHDERTAAIEAELKVRRRAMGTPHESSSERRSDLARRARGVHIILVKNVNAGLWAHHESGAKAGRGSADNSKAKKVAYHVSFRGTRTCNRVPVRKYQVGISYC